MREQSSSKEQELRNRIASMKISLEEAENELKELPSDSFIYKEICKAASFGSGLIKLEFRHDEISKTALVDTDLELNEDHQEVLSQLLRLTDGVHHVGFKRKKYMNTIQ